jgi:hypothetical protein
MGRRTVAGVFLTLLMMSMTAVSVAADAVDTQTPNVFVGVVLKQDGMSTLGLYSATDGHLVRGLAAFGESFTDNGLAVSPNRRSVYFTLGPNRRNRHSLRLMRLDVATRRQTFVAAGEQPAVNDQGTQLAFMTGAEDVAVRDLTTGTTRKVSLARVLNTQIDPSNTPLVWLADGTTLAAIPAPVAIAARTEKANSHAARCRSGKHQQPILFIHVPVPPGRLSIRCALLRSAAAAALTTGDAVLAADPTNPNALWAAGLGAIAQITTTGRATRTLRLGNDFLPLAIDRTAQHILYVKGTPPALWVATIGAAGLTDAHRLISRSRVGPAAW